MSIQSTGRQMLAALSLCACWCAAAAQPLSGQSADSLIDLPAAIRLALDQPALRAASHEVAASEAELDDAGKLPNPDLAWLREGDRSGSSTTTVQLNQRLELGGKRRARVALADSAAALARSERDAQRRQVRAEVVAAYYALLIAQERQQVARSLLALARQGVDVAAKRVAAGKSSPLDETRARLAALDAAGESTHAGGELAVARTTLGALIGRPADGIVLAPRDPQQLPDVAPLAGLLAGAGDSAAVRRAGGQLALQAAQAQVERAARMPDLTLSVGSQRDAELGRRQAVVGLSLPLPLFSRNQGKLGAALRRLDKAQDEFAAARAAAAAQLATAHSRYEVARSEAALLRQDVLPGAASAYELTLKGFEYGKFSFLEVLDAQRTLFQSRARHWKALLEAWRAYADIARLAGTNEHDTANALESQP